jgi:hypothetical protein
MELLTKRSDQKRRQNAATLSSLLTCSCLLRIIVNPKRSIQETSNRHHSVLDFSSTDANMHLGTILRPCSMHLQ